MNNTQMQSEIAKMVGNMQSTHPFYTLIVPAAGAESTGIIPRAANRMIRFAYAGNRANADIFSELKNSWTVGPTVNATNTVTRPTDCIAIQDISVAHSSTLPNWNTTREYPLTKMGRPQFGYLTKDSTVADYPRLYALKGKSILVHPTPSTTYIDYLRVYGIKAEVALVATTDTLYLDPDWHPLVVTFAAAIIAEKLGWAEQAGLWFGSVYDEINRTADVSALQAETGAASVDGAPTRGSVYGGS